MLNLFSFSCIIDLIAAQLIHSLYLALDHLIAFPRHSVSIFFLFSLFERRRETTQWNRNHDIAPTRQFRGFVNNKMKWNKKALRIRFEIWMNIYFALFCFCFKFKNVENFIEKLIFFYILQSWMKIKTKTNEFSYNIWFHLSDIIRVKVMKWMWMPK